MDKRDLMFAIAEGSYKGDYIPAAFFLHFDPACHRGSAAIEKHLEYFTYTDMDIVKVQYEHHMPSDSRIQKPSDWDMVTPLGRDFFDEPLAVVRGIVDKAKLKAPVLVTLYSPFMFAAQITNRDTLRRHMDEDPIAVKRGIDTVVKSMLAFVEGCIEAGVDGFYASTQGGETGFLSDVRLFEDYVKPTDLAVWEVIDAECDLNILHVCDYEGPYANLSAYTDYPGDIVHSALSLADSALTPAEISRLFNRPFMGGMDRHGVLSTGPIPAVEKEADQLLRECPEGYILGADCTVPGDTSWDNLKAAIARAHAGGGEG